MITQQTLSGRAWAELILLSVIWGGSFMAFRVILDEVGVITTVMHRVLWATVLLWIYAFWKGHKLPNDPKIWAAFLVMGLLNNVIPFSLIAWGQLTVETGLASIFNASTAIFGVPIAAIFFADERLSRRKIWGAILGFVGVVLAIGVENLATIDLRSLSQIAFLGATLSYAFAGAWARARLSHLPASIAAAGMLTGSTLIIVPLATYFEGPISLDLSLSTWVAILFLSVFATAIAYLLYYRVLAMAGAANLLLCTLMIVPVAVLLGALMRGEVLPMQVWVGFFLLSIGLIVIDGRLLRKSRLAA